MKNPKIIGLISVLATALLTGGCGLTGNNQANSPAPVAPVAPDTPVTPVTPTTPDSTASQPAAEVRAVNIQNFAFAPARLTVRLGETVTWTNNDSAPHQIKSDTFNSERLSNSQSYSFTFNAAGTFDYYCSIHPAMTGKIIVE